MATSISLLQVIFVFSTLALSADSSEFAIKHTNDETAINFGELSVVISTPTWGMKVVDRATGQQLLAESTDTKHRMGFGKWDGEYFHFYEGYLFRLGLIVEWYHADQVLQWENTTESVSVLVSTSDPEKSQLRVTFTDFKTRQFSMHAKVEGKKANSSNRMAMGFVTPADEAFFGFGERFTDCNQRGHRVGSWLEDGSWSLGVFDPDKWKLRVPKGEESTYCPMPLMLSSHGYGLQMDTYYRTVFDLAKEYEGIVKLEQETNALNVIFYMGTTPRESFSMIIDKNGKSLIPPPWEFSPWNQLNTESPKSQSERIIDFFFKLDIPCSHSINTVHFFPTGDENGKETQLKEENEKLLNLGVKSTCYFNAMLSTGYSKLYNEAAGKGYLLKNSDGQIYNFTYEGARSFYTSQVDYTNPDAVKWYQSQLQRAVDMKFNGWMYDYGEYTPSDSISSDGTGGLEMHNKFPLLYQKTVFDFFTSLDADSSDPYAPDYVFYVRSSYTGSQRYTWAHWTGDPSSDWSYASGLPAQITASLNIGLSGMPFSGSDIGGFEWYVDPVPDLELWARWTAAGSVSGLMHEQGGGKGTGDKSHIFDFPNGTAIWRKFAKLRMQLFPYIYTQAHVAHDTGLPIMQHHLLNFWNDSKAIEQCQQYMFGSDFLAAPVVDRGVSQWEVYLPTHGSGLGPEWLDMGSNLLYDIPDGRFRIGMGQYYNGGMSVKVKVPLDSIPLFVKAGSVIPVLDPRVHTLNNATNSSVITMEMMKNFRHVWVFANSHFMAFGKTWDGLEYKVKKVNEKQLQLSITGAPKYSLHFVQLGGPWTNIGAPVNVSVVTGTLPPLSSWEEVVKDVTDAGFSFDKSQNILWLKTQSSLATITCH